MALFDNIKRVLGFDPQNDIYDDENEQDTTPSQQKSTAPAKANGNRTASKTPTATNTNAYSEDEIKNKASQIFDSVIEIFNHQMPDFVQKSLSTEAQRRYLLDHLTDDLQRYLTDAMAVAQRQCDQRWRDERQEMQSQLDEALLRSRDTEESKAQIKERQLSAERQKRALSERIVDLEKQIMTLEAEKEQYQLETKSLLNKAKVAAVYEKEAEEMRQTLQQLTATPDSAAAKVAEAEEKAAQAAQEMEQIKVTLAQMQAKLDEADMKHALAQEMVNDLQTKASTSGKRAKELDEQIESLTKENNNLNQQIKSLTEERDNALASLSDSNVSSEELDKILQQVSQFEEIKNKLDGRIETLRESLRTERNTNEQLRQTIQDNLMQHAQEQQRMKEEIANLKHRLPDNEQESAKTRSKKSAQRTPKPDTSDVEDILGDTNWLVSRPSKDSTLRTNDNDPDFGYKEPTRKSTPDNDAQLSLW